MMPRRAAAVPSVLRACSCTGPRSALCSLVTIAHSRHRALTCFARLPVCACSSPLQPPSLPSTVHFLPPCSVTAMADVERADAHANARLLAQGGSVATSANSKSALWYVTVIFGLIALCAIAPYLRTIRCGPSSAAPVRYVFVNGGNSVAGTDTQQQNAFAVQPAASAAAELKCPRCPAAIAIPAEKAAVAPTEANRIVPEHHSIFPALPPEFWSVDASTVVHRACFPSLGKLNFSCVFCLLSVCLSV